MRLSACQTVASAGPPWSGSRGCRRIHSGIAPSSAPGIHLFGLGLFIMEILVWFKYFVRHQLVLGAKLLPAPGSQAAIVLGIKVP